MAVRNEKYGPGPRSVLLCQAQEPGDDLRQNAWGFGGTSSLLSPQTHLKGSLTDTQPGS